MNCENESDEQNNKTENILLINLSDIWLFSLDFRYLFCREHQNYNIQNWKIIDHSVNQSYELFLYIKM